ncbi:MAG: class I SAM-dependent methyltransferase [Planctomycetota bacterium]
MTRVYRRDLAHIHDVGFGRFAAAAAAGVLALLRRHGISGGRVVDLGCGPGTWPRSLVAAGYDVVGIDSSRAMIAIARKRAPAARFVVGSLHRVRLPRCHAVTAIGECLNYQFDAARKQPLLALFRRIRTALVTGGMLVFDIAEPGQLRGDRSTVKHFAARDWELVVRARESVARRTLAREIVTFRRVGKLYRRDAETHRLRLFSRAEVAEQLCTARFTFTTSRRYGGFALPPAHTAFVAIKT